MPEIKPAVLESLVGLVVHDLRNPAATLGANIGFVHEVLDDPDVDRDELRDALSDAQQALYELQKGLDQLSWIGRWANEKNPVPSKVELLSECIARLCPRVKYGAFEVEYPIPAVRVQGGEALERMLELLVTNGHQHAPHKVVLLRALSEGDRVVIEVEDQGKAIAPDLAQIAFSLEGQTAVKGRSEGRYGRVAALFAAKVLAEALRAELSSIERAQHNVFRVVLAAL
ncbi:MAG TPA: ATP-binding protein [Polyangiales bacterium]